MENKYYTPSIEEFHIGFQYEQEDINEGGSSLSWYKYTIKEGEAYIIDQLITSEELGLSYRVKYLDKEDIESLGFKFIKNHAGTTQSDFEKENIFLDCDFDFKGKLWLRIYEGEYDNEFNYFSGFIKNKSELKILLKQLSII